MAKRTPHVGSPLIGRAVELEALDRLSEAAASGRGAVVTISGDHGVGKTRLAREVCARAERLGELVLWGRGYDDQGAPAYWPWAEIVSRYVEAAGAQHAHRIMGKAAGEIAASIPALDSVAAGEAGPVEPPSQEARYRLFAAMRGFLHRAAAGKPLLIVLDDLHYCDPDSLRLYEAIAGDLERCGVLLIGTCVHKRVARSPALASALAELARLPWHHGLSIGNLGPADVRRLLEHHFGHAVEAPLADSVHGHTEGNPLFVLEVARHLEGRGEAGVAEQAAAESVAILINRRLARLPAASADLLRTAAVLGRGFEVELLARTASAESGRVRDLLAEPVDGGFLQTLGPDRYRFAHEIVQQAIASTLTPAARASAHRTAGEMLEALRESGEAVDAAALAWHFQEAGAESGAKAAQYLMEAGRKAVEAAAYDTALRWFDAAGAAGRLTPSQRAELAMLRASTLFALARFLDVTSCLLEAFESYSALGDAERAAEAAAFDTLPLGAERLPRDDMRRLRERALALAAPGSLLEARLLCALGESCSYTQPERAKACFARAMELARGFGDRRLEVRVLYARAWLEWRQLQPAACVQTGGEALRVAREIGDRELELVAGARLAIWKLLSGDSAGADQLVLELRGQGELRPSLWTYELQWVGRVLALWRGRWSVYRGYTRDQWVRELGAHRMHDDPLQPISWMPPAELLADLERRPEYYINPERIAMCACRAAYLGRRLDDRSSLPEIEALARRSLSLELSPMGKVSALVALGYVGALRGDSELLAEACGPALAGAPGDLLIEVNGCVVDGARGLFLGLLGRVEEARRLFEQALALARRCHLVFELYRICLEYGAFLLRLGEREKARELAAEARQVAGAGLGLTGLDRELAELTRTLDGVAPDGLTERELEVIRLATAGRSTRQIAAELLISEHTATNHLRHIYGKTGVNNRVDLVGYALRKHIAAAVGKSAR